MNKKIKTPLSVVMDMAKNEIGEHVFRCMEANGIPASLMAYIIKAVLSDVQQMSIEKMSDDFVELQKAEVEETNVD